METFVKIRSESESLRSSRTSNNTANCSLPRGEYIQNVIGPKLTKNYMQPRPISHKLMDGNESADNSPVLPPRQRVLSTTSSESQLSSDDEDETPNVLPKGPSLFSRQLKSTEPNSILSTADSEVQRPPEKFYTPVIGKKKMDLYKFTIMQNASKFSDNQQESANDKTTEEIKQEDIAKVRNALTESLNEQMSIHRCKSESIKQILASDSAEILTETKTTPTTTSFSAKNFIFGSTVDEKILQRHIKLILRGLNYSLKLLKGPPLTYIESRQIVLKELKKKSTKTLLLDLDETLITSCSKRDNPDKILIPEGNKNCPIMIKIRPYVREFLKKMKEHYEILVFTAACSAYAEAVVKELDPDKKFISYIFDRSFCLETKNGFFIKDLRIIKNRDLKNMVIVDNLVHSFGFQIENGIPILEWTGDKNDKELKYLADYLMEAKDCEDMREYNREKLKLVEICQAKFEDTDEL